jgi:hypothetical protein
LITKLSALPHISHRAVQLGQSKLDHYEQSGLTS